MKVTLLIMVNLLVAALMAGFAVWAAGLAPAGTQLPTHWNAAGEVDQMMEPVAALLIPVAIVLFVGLVFAVTPLLEPLQHKLEGSAPLLRSAWVGMLALGVALQAIIAAPIFGYFPGAGAILMLVGLLFVWIGNMLPKSRPGFFVGIRAPWAIIDADNWVATHRLGGKLFMIFGAALVLTALLDVPPQVRVFAILGGTLAAAGIPVAYSWWLWDRQNHSGPGA